MDPRYKRIVGAASDCLRWLPPRWCLIPVIERGTWRVLTLLLPKARPLAPRLVVIGEFLGVLVYAISYGGVRLIATYSPYSPNFTREE